MVPVAGSAYTYAYATLGELMAWIIGWDLVLEYAVGSATVASGWSGYFQKLLALVGQPRSTRTGTCPQGDRLGPLSDYIAKTGEFESDRHSYMDLPAFLITMAITIILVRGHPGIGPVQRGRWWW